MLAAHAGVETEAVEWGAFTGGEADGHPGRHAGPMAVELSRSGKPPAFQPEKLEAEERAVTAWQ